MCTARMPGRETCTGTLQLQCGTAALHLARWRRRLCQPQRPESCVRAGDAFQRRRRDRGTRVSRTWNAAGGTKRERKVRRKKTGVERRIKRERKESHVVAGSRQRRHTQRKEKHPPFVSLCLLSSPFYSRSNLLVSPSRSYQSHFSLDLLHLANVQGHTPSLSRSQRFLSSSYGRFSSFR